MATPMQTNEASIPTKRALATETLHAATTVLECTSVFDFLHPHPEQTIVPHAVRLITQEAQRARQAYYPDAHVPSEADRAGLDRTFTLQALRIFKVVYEREAKRTIAELLAMDPIERTASLAPFIVPSRIDSHAKGMPLHAVDDAFRQMFERIVQLSMPQQISPTHTAVASHNVPDSAKVSEGPHSIQ